MKVIFFPNAGMFASDFHFIRDELPEVDLEVYEYAHHGSRIMEEEYESFESMISLITDDLFSKYGNQNMGICGYCMGSYVAYETTILLRNRYGIETKFLITSGSVPPDEFDKRDKVFETNEEFLQYMISVDGITKEIQSNERLLKAFLPIVKKDAERLHRVLPTQLSENDKLHTPIAVIYGQEDKEINPKTIQNWGNYTETFLGVDEIPGNHFFIFDNQKESIGSFKKFINKALIRQTD